MYAIWMSSIRKQKKKYKEQHWEFRNKCAEFEEIMWFEVKRE